MSELLAYGSPRQRDDQTATLGLVIALGSLSMLFAAAFFAAGLFLLSGPVASSPLPRGAPALAEAALVGGAAAMQIGLFRISRGRPLELSAALIVALLLGLFFLGLEVVVWRQLAVAGMRAASSAGAMIGVLIGLHASSVVAAVGASGTLLVRSFDGSYSAASHLPVRLWTLYWHFVAGVGVLVLALLIWM